MKVKFRKRIISLITCTAIALSCVTMSGFAAFADDDDEGGERTYVTESSWEMTVPQIFVYTENGNGTELQKEDGYQNAKIFIKDTDGSMLTDDCTFKVRGNTTALSWVTKKAYNFKFSKKKDVLDPLVFGKHIKKTTVRTSCAHDRWTRWNGILDCKGFFFFKPHRLSHDRL